MSSIVFADSGNYPFRVDNCGKQLTFSVPPHNLVSIGQSVTEILYALDAGDRIAGTAMWVNDVLPQFAKLDANIDRIAENTPSFEAVVNKRPDLVLTAYEQQIGAHGAVATREQFFDLNIPTYIMPSDCEGKDNKIGDGTRTTPFHIHSLYKGITQIATILGKKDKGATIVSDLKKRHQAVMDRVRSLPGHDVSAVVWFSSSNLAMNPYVAGSKGIPGWILTQLGIRNIINLDEEWPAVGWEYIAKANPTFIVIARMARNRFLADHESVKLQFLKNDPVTRHMKAVKENHIIILDAEALQHSLRVISGLEILANHLIAFRP